MCFVRCLHSQKFLVEQSGVRLLACNYWLHCNTHSFYVNFFSCLFNAHRHAKYCLLLLAFSVNETFHDASRLHLNFITEDCFKLQVISANSNWS